MNVDRPYRSQVASMALVTIVAASGLAWRAHTRGRVGRTQATSANEQIWEQRGPAAVLPSPSFGLKQPARENRPSVPTSNLAPTVDFEEAFDPDLTEPSSQESVGDFRGLYEAWRTEDDDLDATADAWAMLKAAFSAFDIHPDAQNTSCTETLCRARFRFRELKELYAMSKIQEPDGVKLATTFADGEEGSYTVSVYWPRKPDRQGRPLTRTLGKPE